MKQAKWILSFLLVSINLALLFSGVFTLMIGMIIFRQLIVYGFFLDGKVFIPPFLLTTAALLILSFIVFFALFGIIQNNHELLMTYTRFVVVVALIQLTAAVVSYSCKNDSRNIYSDVIKRLVYNPKKSFDPMDRLQRTLGCCGYYGPWDYLEKIPRSCKENQDHVVIRQHERGCKAALKDFLLSENNIISGISMVMITVEVAGIIITRLVDETIRQKIVKNVKSKRK